MASTGLRGGRYGYGLEGRYGFRGCVIDDFLQVLVCRTACFSFGWRVNPHGAIFDCPIYVMTQRDVKLVGGAAKMSKQNILSFIEDSG